MYTSTRHSIRSAVVGAALVLLPVAAASADTVNGIKLNTRVFNDFTTSTLVATNTNTNPGTVTIAESNYTNDGVGGNFANRHDALFSGDGGATALVLNTGKSFTQSMIINLADGSNTPRKEAGLRINSPITGDALFIINSDAGEIVAFGGGAAFYSFGNNGGSNGYTPGTSLYMAEKYTASTTPGVKGTIQYYINRNAANGMGAGVETSGPLLFDNNEGGPVSYSIGAYTQIAPNLGGAAPDFATVSFTNMSATVVPEPTTLAGLALGSLILRRRR